MGAVAPPPPEPAQQPPSPVAVPLQLSALLTALVAFGPLSTDLYLPSLPSLTTALGGSVADGQLTLSAFLIAFALGMPIYGPLSDRFGRRPVILGGLAFYLAASLLCAFAPGIETLIAARALQGLAASAGPVVARAVVRDLFPPEQAARVFSYMATAMGVAPALGPLIGGQLEVFFGWRASFLTLTGFAVAMLLWAQLRLPETNREPLMDATRMAPMLRNYRRLLADPRFRRYALVVAFSYAAIFAWISGSSFVLIDLAGLSPPLFGLCFAIFVCGYMAGAYTSARLSTRLGARRLILIGCTWALVWSALLLTLSLIYPPGILVTALPMALTQAGIGMMLPNGQAGAIGPFPKMAGTASSLMGLLQMCIAAAVGTAVGHALSTDAVPMVAATLLCIVSALAVMLVPDRPKA